MPSAAYLQVMRGEFLSEQTGAIMMPIRAHVTGTRLIKQCLYAPLLSR
ncbi:MAG: hypothetical protein M0R33_05655 [Methylomonas sp.]|jgi:hypothetical protein|nr:hypothetical protein [Methylomonas sp.]MCK9605920.1 hypothetical protein [Methylomonas sp.]